MAFYAFHGVLEQEQKTGNYFRVDLKLWVNSCKAIETDNLDDTLNYGQVFDVVKEEMSIPSKLLEHVAGRIVNRISRTFTGINKIEIRLAKARPPVGGEVEEAAVIIEKGE